MCLHFIEKDWAHTLHEQYYLCLWLCLAFRSMDSVTMNTVSQKALRAFWWYLHLAWHSTDINVPEKGKGKYVGSRWRLSCLSNYFEMSWFLFSIPLIDSALKPMVISYPTKGTVNHFYCLWIPRPILTATNKPGVMGEVPQLCSAVEGGVWGCHCFFMDPTASRTRIPSLPSQAWAIWPCEKEVPLTLHRWGSCPHFPPSGSGRSSTNNSLMLQTCILWSPSSCLTWQHLQPLQHFMNEETAKLICFWFSCSYVIISKSFIVLVLRTDLAFNLYFFFKVILSKFSLSVEEIESYESHSKSFLGSAVAFSMGNWQGLRCEWRQRKPVSSRSPVTERLLAHMSKRKCANLPSTANSVCLPETLKVWCILGI